MARQNLVWLAFNRGLVSDKALARIDLKRMAMAASIMVNWMARTLGSMMLRPGLAYLAGIYNNAAPRFLPFIFSITDKALLELTDSIMRVWISDAVVTRPAVTSTLTNGTFLTNLANWTDDDDVGGVSAWISAGLVGFTGTGTAFAKRTQGITVAGANIGVEHALRIVVARGPLVLLVGSTAGTDNYINETTLDTGTHSLAFTPTGDFYVRFQSNLARLVELSQCTLEAAGAMTLPTPWIAADLSLVQFDQSGDILFIASGKTADKIGYQQRKIERRATRSWSVVLYTSLDGPFRDGNTTVTTMTPSVLEGNGTLTASLPFFRTTHVGALFAVTSTGQTASKTVAAANDRTGVITVEGVGEARSITIVVTANAGTGDQCALQQSLDGSTWNTLAAYNFVNVDGTATLADGLDNQTVYYRGNCGVYAAGNPVMNLYYAGGTIRGIGRVTSFSSTTVANIEVLTTFGGTTATDNWEEGQWSDYRGWPSSVAIYEGRLWWAGKDAFVGSASDDYTNNDATAAGDGASINRTIGSGPVDRINWLLPMLRLLAGAEGAEFSARSTAFDEPLTPSNFNLKRASTQGSARVRAVVVDDTGVFVQRGGSRIFELAFDGNKYDYTSTQLSLLVPEIGMPGIARVAVQRQPDTRVHFVRTDGTAAVVVYDKLEDVKCWLEITAGGTNAVIEDVVILPGDIGDDEDDVYYAVARTVNGSTVRYLEKWALESECVGGTTNKQADSFVTFNQAASTTIGGMTHLVGESVVVWQDGTCPLDANFAPKTYTVNGSGQITVDTAATTGMVGLAYTAPWQSAKLAQLQAQLGTELNQQKIIRGLGVVAQNFHRYGLQFGTDANNLNDMPSIETGAPVSDNAVRATYDETTFIFPGQFSADARLYLLARAPLPVTLLATVAEAGMNET